MGDVGSVPLGYLLGFLLLYIAAQGGWRPAIILPLYFLADATITLLRRLARGERVWQPHREHFYQRAVQRGLSHADVVRRVIAANVVLIGCRLGGRNRLGDHRPCGSGSRGAGAARQPRLGDPAPHGLILARQPSAPYTGPLQHRGSA